MYTYRDYQPVWAEKKVVRNIPTLYDDTFYFEQELGTTLVALKDDFNHDAIKNSIRNIFLVQQNSVPGKPWFGNPLNKDVFDLFDDTKSGVVELAIKDAIHAWEPRIFLEDVEVILKPEYNRIIITITYSIIINNHLSKDTLSLPFNHNDMSFLDGRPMISYTSPLSN